MRSLGHDVRYAVRQLLRTPAFTAAAVITLALGIGMNTAFFAVVNAFVFRPMRAQYLEGVYTPSFDSGRKRLTLEHYRLLERNLPDGVEAVDAQLVTFTDVLLHVPGRAERTQYVAVSGGHQAVFRLRPQAGRFISADDDRGAVPSAVISDRIWREWFGGDRSIVERANIRIDNEVYQVVGVAPPGSGAGVGGFGVGTVDVWIPLSRAKAESRFVTTVATHIRLREGVSPEAVAPAIKAAVAGGDDAVQRMWQLGDVPVELHPDTHDSPFRSAGVVVLWLSSLVLLAACANLANMLYTRGVHRRAELSVRRAIGASTGRIFRMLMTEALVISVSATLLGLALALVATWQFNAAFPLFRDRYARVTIDLSPDYFVFLYAMAAGIGAALLVGGITAWRASRVPPMRGMAVGDAATSVTHASRRARLALVALQVGAAVVLLMAAGLVYRQSGSMTQGTVRFDTHGLATARIDLARHGYTFHDAQVFLRRAGEAAAAMPGVEKAAIADGVPGGGYMGGLSVTFAAERTDLPFTQFIRTSNPRLDGRLVSASSSYLATLGLRIVRGRDLTPNDRDGAPLSVIVSEGMAAGLWPKDDALGNRLMFGNDGYWRTVVGVFENPSQSRRAGPRERLFDPARLVVTPFEQRYPDDPAVAVAAAQARGSSPATAARFVPRQPREMVIVMRAPAVRGQLDALRQVVAELDPDVAIFDAATVDEAILAEMAPRRAGRLLMGGLGGAALAIATLGIYGVVSFLVARRTREFGIRMALGAQKRQVVKMVVDDAVHLLLVGLFLGVFGFAVAERSMQARRFGFLPNEISTWVAVLLGILAVGLFAAFIPARRAASIDPNIALRDL